MDKTLMMVSFDEESGQYKISLGEGSSIPETAFSMAVVIKCLVKDGYLEKKEDMVELINKYLTDPQYEEIEDVDNSNNG